MTESSLLSRRRPAAVMAMRFRRRSEGSEGALQPAVVLHRADESDHVARVDPEAPPEVRLAGPVDLVKGGEQCVLLAVRADRAESHVAEPLRPYGGLAQQPARQGSQAGRCGLDVHGQTVAVVGQTNG